MPKLIVSGVGYDLVEQVVTIGRAPDNTIHIDDSSVSGRHAELRRADKTYQLRDLGSTNGTRVNGTGTNEITLHPGDRVRLAQAVPASRAAWQWTQLSRYLLQPRSMLRWRRPAFVRQILPMPHPSGAVARSAISAALLSS